MRGVDVMKESLALEAEHSQKLWQVVLCRAAIDAARNGDFTYFAEESEDLKLVCEFAGVERKEVIACAQSGRINPLGFALKRGIYKKRRK